MTTSKTSSRPVKGFLSLCRRFYENPRFEVLRTTRNRRRIVALYVLSLAALPATAWATGQFWAVMVSFALWQFAVLALGLATRGLTEKPMKYLDERERHARQSMFREPYWVGAIAGLGGGLVMADSFNASEAMSTALFFLVFGVLWGLPNTAMALRLPEEESDDG